MTPGDLRECTLPELTILRTIHERRIEEELRRSTDVDLDPDNPHGKDTS